MASFSIPKMVKEQVPKSLFNQQCCRRTTATVGVHIPIYHKYILPGDEFRIDKVAAKIKSQPFVVPLMGAFRVQMDWFFEPLTNLYGFMDNNDTLGTSDILKQDLFTFGFYKGGIIAPNGSYESAVPWFAPDYISAPGSVIANIGHVAPSTIFNYLGIPADWDSVTGNMGIDNRTNIGTADSYDSITNPNSFFRADAFLAYWDIYRSYYSNKQSKKCAIYTGQYAISDTYQSYKTTPVQYIDQSVLDNMFKELRMMKVGNRNLSNLDTYTDSAPNVFKFMKLYAPHIRGVISKQWINSGSINYVFGKTNSFLLPFTGLGCAQYRPDVYRSVMLPATPEISASINADVIGDSVATFSIDSLRVASHYQKLLDLYDASGGQFSKWIDMQFDVDITDQLDRPILLQSSHQYITVDDVTALGATNLNSDGTGQEVRVGEQFGQVNTGAGFRGVKFRSRYHGVLMCIVTIVPEVDYSNNYAQDIFDTKFSDLYTPAMAQLGYEGMTVGDFYAGLPIPRDTAFDESSDLTYRGVYRAITGSLDTNTEFLNPYKNTVCGRNVHWWRYMSDVNRTFGSMSVGLPLESWTLQRRFYTRVPNDTGSATEIPGSGGLSTEYYGTKFNLTPYINPADWNYFFAYQQSGAENWQMQFAFDIEAKRPIPKYVLGRIV